MNSETLNNKTFNKDFKHKIIVQTFFKRSGYVTRRHGPLAVYDRYHDTT